MMIRLSCLFLNLFLVLLCRWTSLEAEIWSFPEDLSTFDGNGIKPLVKINDEGKGVAVWRETVELNTVIRASIFQDGLWSDPVTINPPTSYTQIVNTRSISIDLNNKSIVIVVWEEGPISGPTTIQAARLIKDVWRITSNIALLPVTPIASPQVAIDCEGNAVAIWNESLLPGSRTQVSALPFKEGTWSIPLTISDGEITTTQAKIAAGTKGNFIAIWIGDAILRARALTLKSILKNRLRSSIIDLSNGGPLPSTPVISSNAEGLAGVIWSEQPLSVLNSSIKTRFFHFNRGKINRLGDIVTLADETSRNTNPDIKINHHGAAVAAWQSTSDGTNSFIISSIFRHKKWSENVIISDLVFPFAEEPKVGIDEKGNAVAIWVGNDNAAPVTFNAIQSNTFHKCRWGSIPLQLSAPGADSSEPQVSTNSEGRTIAVWARNFIFTVGRVVQASDTHLRH